MITLNGSALVRSLFALLLLCSTLLGGVYGAGLGESKSGAVMTGLIVDHHTGAGKSAASSRNESRGAHGKRVPSEKQRLAQVRSDLRGETLLKSGRAMLDQGRWDTALDQFSQYIIFKPIDPEGHFWQGVAFDESGNPTAAVESYKNAIEKAEEGGMASAEIWTNLGNVSLKIGQVDQAVDAFRTAVSIDPELVPARLNLARAQIEKGECQAALESLNRCSDLHFNGVQLPYYRAKALLKLGRSEEAAVQVDKLLTKLTDEGSKNKVREEFKTILRTH